MLGWRSVAGAQGIRVEDLEKDGRCIVRAELPGIDPDRDLERRREARRRDLVVCVPGTNVPGSPAISPLADP
jgi:hypothetical protein